MNVRTLAVALIWVVAGTAVSSPFAGASTAPSDNDSATVFGSATLSNLQDVGGSAKAGGSAATVGANALRGASGNIGVNLAAGALNAQANQIALISTPKAAITSQQDLHTVAQLTGSTTAKLSAGSLAALSGNVGVNIASGVGNAQLNGLIIH
ncbi:hypothetical protein B0G76_0626 [Paraburkholderia sp. BL23I1N1]|uniref:hypothetical protein n=1 Tax=Paraburkholderia sp. BL23I1N1 TaxID=1938802 RepID=UPI000E7363BC|nr:hypothetical protein [Paraburkholderia sp. BL23I1N1]RKE34615.1 hypothetical protein B0G76_0626 [Paraburkholderia sp. BL23I1N1]